MKRIWKFLVFGCLLFMLTIPVVSETQAATIFTPRISAPGTTNKYYLKKGMAGGGVNECIAASGNSTIPNCVGYAWGRAYEILGRRPNLSTGNARTFYPENKKRGAFSYGQTPKIGSIVCWSYGYQDNSAGHVAVIEKIIGNKITISESSWKGARFSTATMTQAKLQSRFKGFQGYIYLGDYKLATNITFKYNPIGGQGSIPSQTVNFNSYLTTSGGTGFSKVGYTLKGWYAYRDRDATYYVNNVGWCTQSTINKKGYTKYLYPLGCRKYINSYWTTDFTVDHTFSLLAVWSPNTYKVSFNPGDGTGSVASKNVRLNEQFTIPGQGTMRRPGYKFLGWNSCRTSDNKFYCANKKGWNYLSTIIAKGYSMRLYKPGEIHYIDPSSWLSNSMKNSNTSIKFVAVWQRIPPTSVRLNVSSKTVYKGKTYKLNATIGPSTADKTVTWTSSNKRIATVTKYGTVKGIRKGTAVITVRTYNGKTAKCKITVK